MARTPDREKGRKPYAKPVAKRVRLKPEEAVLGFCKTGGYTGPNGTACASGFACITDGS